MSTKRRRVLWAVVGVLAVVLAGSVAVGVIVAALNSSETNQRGEKRAPQVEKNDDLLVQVKLGNERIESCTTPGGDCYERGQRQTAKAVGDISRVIVLAAACAGALPDGLTADERADRITTCVTERLPG